MSVPCQMALSFAQDFLPLVAPPLELAAVSIEKWRVSEAGQTSRRQRDVLLGATHGSAVRHWIL